ncbi:response regulator [Paraburkholderia sp. MMS20-SJTN17]|uniref:Response regulator n=1 Tax=Paraburkholderia translucens TaxID=2886945 RepID=A0ABS8KKK3_9BURK|nr:response regulator [Paraburkholderia sp. MMS20-SJTN17]MCC8405311.1 response regulator [Paraburkholderia sp. MMS20-SJTN17]
MANILLVDDDAENLSSLQLALESDGHQVSVAGDGQRALAILHHESIQFMITDYEMPDINGAELCRLVHAQHAYSELPILMLSAAPEPPNPWTSWGRFLRKPARFEELAAAIHAGVSRRMITGKQPSRTVSVSAVLRRQIPAASRWQPVHAGCWP